jgi:hypothetical protein
MIGLQIFPVPGEYHFRFRKNIGSISVWMDVVDESAQIPVEPTGTVVAKVSRISLKGVQSVNITNVVVPARSNPVNSPSPRKSVQIEEKSDQVVSEAPKTRERRNSDKLISFDNFDEPSNSPSPGDIPICMKFSFSSPIQLQHFKMTSLTSPPLPPQPLWYVRPTPSLLIHFNYCLFLYSIDCPASS